MISHEYSHQVSRARTPNCVAMYATPPHISHVDLRSAFLFSSSLTWEKEITNDITNIQKYHFTSTLLCSGCQHYILLCFEFEK